ncbi:coiled-coil domain-containing protein 158-like isoform X1 [Triplophysa dalaica]|uniref:coiled-coil domain-containing protein 158-like isoform X1 n=1 Tax=Triplophysa dalaica TaxID=1582913 RepID=UPI0024DF793B|nr:coiled-coil domain-containing protein 158-like isoform X1 [Triplophysa dalaica]XP_056601657.1 coiled-coil domain-containing protein 158-like isoform X1 [Triplophysa dalaica]XP_056601658.1 coiled-coil domain-containing protein 158-like isoform X1 [Triplophysa dalaica]XP_056601659.1 coiled-coil domain-containing protein 158-like isoform X1 [Triplophysa dalaica]XP_056601661.1 coiled-coil domain-containing protein 158-like isoform X1 [Triplophysa dalaica]
MSTGLSLDNNCLTKQIDSLIVENQQLKAALRQAELRLSTIERERACQQVSLSEKICTVHELTAAKQQMRAVLAARHTQVIRPKGLKFSLGMQRQITAKREQIDFLQVQIQQLEETVEKLKLDKHQQALEVQRQTQELMSESEIRRTLEAEVKASYSQERGLKRRAERLEAALYKMSGSFAECQDFIQEQEQEIMRSCKARTVVMSPDLQPVSISAMLMA